MFSEKVNRKTLVAFSAKEGDLYWLAVWRFWAIVYVVTPEPQQPAIGAQKNAATLLRVF
jgi:hypothetical protein